jgi:DNA primase
MTDRATPIDAAKQRHSLVEVAERTGIPVSHVNGRLVTVRCPMPEHGHPDRTPSLRLDSTRQTWWCFACSPTDTDGTPKAGDVIDWVRRTEAVDWRAAIDILDSGAPLRNTWRGRDLDSGNRQVTPSQGVEAPDITRTSATRVQRALETAWMYYTSPELHARGRRYLDGRRIDVEMLERHNRRYEVGHTPSGRGELVAWMRRRGFSEDELVDSGLAHRNVNYGRLVDFYRQRVLIPVRDAGGGLCGFIGRNVGDDRWPKYKNPPRTVRYDKSVNLYQPLPAPEQAAGQVVVVEGTLDAMAIAVAAIWAGRSDWYCPLTQSGRELSPRQLRYALSLHDRPPVIAMDGDGPGRSSSQRIEEAAAAVGVKVKITDLPEDADPASWLADHGTPGLTAFDRTPVPGVDRPVLEGALEGRSSHDQLAALRLARTIESVQAGSANLGIAAGTSRSVTRTL